MRGDGGEVENRVEILLRRRILTDLGGEGIDPFPCVQFRLLETFAYAMLMQMSASDLSIGDAARAIGVSVDTLRRWDRAGKVRTVRDERNRRRVPTAEVERLSAHPERHRTGDTLSARNRFRGVVRSVEVDGVMALVEIEAGPHRITAAITRDSVEELRLAEGVEATAMVKATSVMIERS